MGDSAAQEYSSISPNTILAYILPKFIVTSGYTLSLIHIFLARCLDSYAGTYDELIIVDTGSTDNTKEIAAHYTDKIYDFEWINDFSAARNFAFSKAECDYIFSADADEVLDDTNNYALRELKHMPVSYTHLDILSVKFIPMSACNYRNPWHINAVFFIHKSVLSYYQPFMHRQFHRNNFF